MGTRMVPSPLKMPTSFYERMVSTVFKWELSVLTSKSSLTPSTISQGTSLVTFSINLTSMEMVRFQQRNSSRCISLVPQEDMEAGIMSVQDMDTGIMGIIALKGQDTDQGITGIIALKGQDTDLGITDIIPVKGQDMDPGITDIIPVKDQDTDTTIMGLIQVKGQWIMITIPMTTLRIQMPGRNAETCIKPFLGTR